MSLSGSTYYSPTIDITGAISISSRFTSFVTGTVVKVQHSTDGLTWTDIESISLPANIPLYKEYTVTKNYFRVTSNQPVEVLLATRVVS